MQMAMHRCNHSRARRIFMTGYKREDMTKHLTFAAGIAAIVCTAGCSDISIDLAGYTESKTIPVSMDFTGVEVEDAIEVIFSDTMNEAYIEADANVLPYVEIYEDYRGILTIGYSAGLKMNGNGYFRTIVEIPYKSNICHLSASGASIISSGRPFIADEFYLNASGASAIYGKEVTADNITMELSGAGRVEFDLTETGVLDICASGASSLSTGGCIDTCNMQLDGGSAMDGRALYGISGLYIDKCYGSLSGGSTAWFSTDNGTISCSLTGGSHIYYAGNAYDSSTVSGGSSVEPYFGH